MFHDAIERELRSIGELYDMHDMVRIAALFQGFLSMGLVVQLDCQRLKALRELLPGICMKPGVSMANWRYQRNRLMRPGWIAGCLTTPEGKRQLSFPVGKCSVTSRLDACPRKPC